MTDPQLPPPSGAVPPVAPPPAAPTAPSAPPASSYGAAPVYGAAPAQPAVPAPPAPGGYGAPPPPVPQAAPPGAYQVPVGGYTAPAGAYAVPETPVRRSGLLGLLALILALVAAVVMPIIVGVAGYEIGARLPQGIDTGDSEVLSVLSPARDQVLWAEISFWVGTVLGIAAIVLGIVAIRKKQGRGTGIAALVVAVLGPIIFFLVLLLAFSVGSATGFAGYTG